MTQYIDMYFRLWGDRDITNEIEVTSSNNSLTLQLDDESEYLITLSNSTYRFAENVRQADIVDEFNRQIDKLNLPLKCILGGVKGSTRKYSCIVFQSTNDKKLVAVSGSFTDLLLE